MNVKYIPNGNTKIVVDGKTYQNEGEKIASLPVEKISAAELDRLLKMKFIKKFEFKEAGGTESRMEKPDKPKNNKHKPDKTRGPLIPINKEKLLKTAEEAGFTVTDEMLEEKTYEEILQLISEAKARA